MPLRSRCAIPGQGEDPSQQAELGVQQSRQCRGQCRLCQLGQHWARPGEGPNLGGSGSIVACVSYGPSIPLPQWSLIACHSENRGTVSFDGSTVAFSSQCRSSLQVRRQPNIQRARRRGTKSRAFRGSKWPQWVTEEAPLLLNSVLHAWTSHINAWVP